ncbi:ste12 interacting protein [Phialemonium atrogriseum]|uniref:Ste12 interacting protein n=1 Tax=Phialemonium atrogriseum TaxID=1093897 RepID=A0AAJ0FSF4_9PEZI|nr:ste12 interacting protein [Phialemonium atrogriseum]KAK1771105.1 ste12 interacting protein [Phialemonium atrogriseum]
MSPTYTMSAHLCKQIYSSWRQTRQTSPEAPLSPPTTNITQPSYFRRSPSPEKRSMDSDRSDSGDSSWKSSSSSSNSRS